MGPTAALSLMPMGSRLVRTSPMPPYWLRPGLDNVKLANDNTITTDYRGYAIVPYVTPYRRTDITLDSTSLGEDMELPETTQSVVPTRGAIVRANYAGNIGQRAFVHLKTASGGTCLMARWCCSPATASRSQASSATPGWSICPACSKPEYLTCNGAKARRSNAMLPLLYRRGRQSVWHQSNRNGLSLISTKEQ